MDAATAENHKKLVALRSRKSLALKPTPILKTTYVAMDGTERPLMLRYYQVQMVFHLLAMKRFIVGDDCGLGKCCRRGTLISTTQGLIPIELLQPGEMEPDTFLPVEGWQVALKGGMTAPIQNFYYGGVKPTRKVTTRYGFEVEGSLVHPMLARRDGGEQFIKIPDLDVGDYLCVDRRGYFPEEEPTLRVPQVGDQVAANTKSYPVPNRMNPELARLIGYIVGEAWVKHHYGFSVSQSQDKNPETSRDIHNLLREQFGWVASKEIKDTQVWSRFLRAYLEYMGVDYTLSARKTVPPPILRATRASTREFLRGLFEGEASAVSTGGVEFTTASEEMGKQVQLLLLRFGIVANRSPKRVRAYPNNTYWRLTIFGDDARRFADEIGFVSSRKISRLKEVIPEKSNPNHDVIPYTLPLFDQVREDLKAVTSSQGSNATRRGSGLKQFGTDFISALNNIRNLGCRPSYGFVQRVIDILHKHAPASKALPQLELLWQNRYFYDPIVSFEDGAAEVFDIEVADSSHCFVGNGLVNHNTLESIAALAYLWSKEPERKVIVLTKKSAVEQWADEFRKFTEGVHVVVAKGTPTRRQASYEEFSSSSGPTVLIMGYRAAVQDFTFLQEWSGFILISDECSVYKTPSTQVHQVCKHLGMRADRVWALTATMIKNHLLEGYGIYQVVVPGLFRMSKNAFMKEYCITKMQPIGNGRKVPVIVGYRDSDIQIFRDKIDPYYLGRPKHEVADELPTLTTRDIFVGMSNIQRDKYADVLEGLLEFGDGQSKETDHLSAITYCQEIVDHPCLIGFEDADSEKLDALVDILTDGDLEHEKVIVFTRFRKMVDFAIPYLEKRGVKCVRVTGSEDEDERKASQDAFQDLKSDTRVVWITMAGGEAINLQAAKAMIFFDLPWSAGDYLQILGRMVRIGSLHDRVYALHLLVKESVDERVLGVLKKKMKLIEAVLGQRIKGDTTTPVIFDNISEVKEIFEGLVQDARKKKERK